MPDAAPPAKPHVLVVEDDDAICEALQYNLEREGYRVTTVYDGLRGLEQARELRPDAIVLDLMLPTLNGVEVCRELRADPSTKNVAILMLTAKSEESDQLIGFTVGADDYVTKPFSVKVLVQRLRVLLQRRRETPARAEVVRAGGLVMDDRAHEVTADGQVLPLTPTEYRLLETLMRQPGKAFSRTELLGSIVGDDIVVLERTVDVHVRALRVKLGERAHLIETVRGVGYRFTRQ